jgi:hypothetical protein
MALKWTALAEGIDRDDAKRDADDPMKAADKWINGWGGFICQCEQNWPCRIAESGHAFDMASETLSPEEFASLLLAGNTPVNGPAPTIPAAHSARLIELGYMADIAGRLRMTTPGRFRIYAGQIADAVTSLALDEAPASEPASAQSIPYPIK